MASPRFAGIDIGSRTVELVVLENGAIVEYYQDNSGPDPLATSQAVLGGTHFDAMLATGYGRELMELHSQAPTVTEIKAYAVGARRVCPDCRTILDIGGQDIKAISLYDDGRVRKFEMNDRCAAGSGKFLEMMAIALGYTLAEFAVAALNAEQAVSISSMCAVFAESEVTSLLHRGSDRAGVALGLHRSVLKRTLSMLSRVGITGPLVFAGGVAQNRCMQNLLNAELGIQVVIPNLPQHVGALGAALLAQQNHK